MKIFRTIALVMTVAFALMACSTPAQLLMLSNDGEFINYTGTATLNGAYFSNPSNIEIHEFVCFLPDDHSQELLPHDSDVNPFHWMCFSNSAEARELFGLKSLRNLDSVCHKGLASITVRNYRRYIAESEGVSFSELTNVHQHSAASEVPCDAIHSP